MIRITDRLVLDDSEVDVEFTRSSGPGGQHVNTSSTAVQLRFDVEGSDSLPVPVKRRLKRLAGNRITSEGHLLIEAGEHRSQSRNRAAAEERLAALIRRAARPPRRRKKTRPPASSKRRRLENKRRRGELKKLRRPPKRGE